MKKLLIFLGALALQAQTVSLSDTLTNAVGGGSFTGRITVTLNAPGSASPLYYSTTSLTGWQAVYCLGVTGSDCTTTTAAGVFAATLYANSTITPAGTSYSARFTPAKGSPWSEVWVITPSTTTLRQIRATTVPTPTTTFQASQLALAAGSMVYGSSAGVGTALAAGSNGQVLALSGGYPAWTTNIAGNAGTATALAANGTNCAAGTFPLGVDASGNSESCTALPTTISGTANQITASAATGAVTLSLPTTITGLTSVTSTGFTGALTGNASTATALSSTVASGRIWYGNGTGAPGSASTFVYDSANGRLGVGTNAPASILSLQGSNPILGLYASANVTGQGSVQWFLNNQTKKWGVGMNEYATLDLEVYDGSGLAAVFKNSSRNLIIGSTTTDLGYGLHAANKGTNGNLLVFDPTATTGTTKAVFRGGAGQSGNIFEINRVDGSIAGGVYAKLLGSNDVQFGLLSSGGSQGVALHGGGLQAGLSASIQFGLGTVTGVNTTTFDLSLSRASAGVLQVGDGGANANGKIAAAVGLFGGAADAGFKLHVNATAAYTGDTAGAFILTDSATPAKRLYMGYDASADVGFINSVYSGVANKPLALNAAGGNVLIGTVTDLGYGLHASKKGTNGNLLVYDPTATTGNTKEVIRAGQGQTTNLTEWQNYAGTVISRVANTGEFLAPNGTSSLPGLSFTGSTTTGMYWDGTYLNLSVTGSRVMYIRNGDIGLPSVAVLGNTQVSGATDGNLLLKNNAGTSFTCLQLGGTTSSFPCLKRSGAALQARLADDTAYSDVGLNAVIVNKAAPAASTDACTAGQLWAGDMGGTKYTFYCVASGTIVRSAFASF